LAAFLPRILRRANRLLLHAPIDHQCGNRVAIFVQLWQLHFADSEGVFLAAAAAAAFPHHQPGIEHAPAQLTIAQQRQHQIAGRFFGDGATRASANVRAEFYVQTPVDGTQHQKQEIRRKRFNRALERACEKQLVGVREIDAVTYLWLLLQQPSEDEF